MAKWGKGLEYVAVGLFGVATGLALSGHWWAAAVVYGLSCVANAAADDGDEGDEGPRVMRAPDAGK